MRTALDMSQSAIIWPSSYGIHSIWFCTHKWKMNLKCPKYNRSCIFAHLVETCQILYKIIWNKPFFSTWLWTLSEQRFCFQSKSKWMPGEMANRNTGKTLPFYFIANPPATISTTVKTVWSNLLLLMSQGLIFPVHIFLSQQSCHDLSCTRQFFKKSLISYLFVSLNLVISFLFAPPPPIIVNAHKYMHRWQIQSTLTDCKQSPSSQWQNTSCLVELGTHCASWLANF